MNEQLIKTNIASNLSSARDNLRITQKEAAKKASMNVNYYAKVERGESIPSIKTLEKICKALKISATGILGF
jgi:transcriptional regulator with XRE-family HTH domain